jgi:hypothetical protein
MQRASMLVVDRESIQNSQKEQLPEAGSAVLNPGR